MQIKRSLLIQLFLLILVINALLLGAIYWQWQAAIDASGQYLLFGGIGAAASLLLWGILALLASRAINQTIVQTSEAVKAATLANLPKQPVPQPVSQPRPEPIIPKLVKENAPRLQPVAQQSDNTTSALQLLAILQRDGRLLDFLQEDLSFYEDDQIGAAVRTIHEGCKKAILNHIQLEPVMNEAEGSSVAIPVGFDAYAIRLTGAVTGNPPFYGTLRHRGWRASKIDLPQQLSGQEPNRVIAAAEVEIGG